MPNTCLDTGDAELTEMLEFLDDWLAADRGELEASLGRFVEQPPYGLSDLRSDLARFIFLLGGSDGELLFQPGPRQTPSCPGRAGTLQTCRP